MAFFNHFLQSFVTPLLSFVMTNYEGGRGRMVKVSDVSDPVFVATEENVPSEEARFSFNDYWVITELINFGGRERSLLTSIKKRKRNNFSQ